MNTLIAEARLLRADAARELEARLVELRTALAAPPGPSRPWTLGNLIGALTALWKSAGRDQGRFDRFVTERLGLPRTKAWKWMAVARALPEHVAARLGPERAYALVVYARRTGLDAAMLAANDGPIDGRPLSETSLRELAAATTRARHAAPPTAAAKERRATVRAVTRRLATIGVPASAVQVGARGMRIVLAWPEAERIGRRR
jgi:hypothetical protein